MYHVSTDSSTACFDTFNLAWAYAQQLGQPFTITFSPPNVKIP